jgi:NAD(P)-dependent dehydrogenase (short-subunit alcohol dehydrogenase family)
MPSLILHKPAKLVKVRNLSWYGSPEFMGEVLRASTINSGFRPFDLYLVIQFSPKSQESHIAAIVAKTLKAFGKLDFAFNNAKAGSLASQESDKRCKNLKAVERWNSLHSSDIKQEELP